MNKAFTLTELAIVLVIIGIIVAGISEGKSLLHSAKIKSIVNDVNVYKTAIIEFRDQFKAWPGDLDNASSYWPTTCEVLLADCNGDGTRQIEGNESLLAWKHLNLSGVLVEKFSGITNDTVPILGDNVPASKIKGNGFDLSYNAVAIYGRSDNHITYAKLSVGGLIEDGALTPEDSLYINQKLDNGLAEKGNVNAENGTDMGAGDCVTGVTGYDLASTKKACRMIFWLERQRQ